MSTYSFTGHRPPKLGGYSLAAQAKLDQFALDLMPAIAAKYGTVEHIITGMALGWDTAVAKAARSLRIPYSAAIPCMTQCQQWPAESQRTWRELLDDSAEVVEMAEVYSPDLMQMRNEWMVDHSDMLISLWNGTAGGTANCVRYAKSINRAHANAWQRWLKFTTSNHTPVVE